MAFNRPSIPDIIERIQSDIEANLDNADARLRFNLLNIEAIMLAGAVHGLYGHLDHAVKQFFPYSADDDDLDQWANLYLRQPRIVATFATGLVVFTGADGAIIDADTEMQTSDGVLYHVDTEVIMTNSIASVPITCSVAGQVGNLAAGTRLTLTTTIAGVNGNGTVDVDGIAGGAETESNQRLLSRITDHVQLPPHGGAWFDYVQWAKAAHPAVTRVWPAPLENGPSSVVVRFVTDNVADAPIPSAQVVDIVQAYINNVKPVTASVTVQAPASFSVDMNIQLSPNATAVQAAVTAELIDLFKREAEPGNIVPLSKINEAISIAIGEQDHTLISPAGDISPGINHLAVLGNITWS